MSDAETLRTCLASAEAAQQRVRSAIALAEPMGRPGLLVEDLEAADAHLADLVAYLRPRRPPECVRDPGRAASASPFTQAGAQRPVGALPSSPPP